MVEIGRIGLQTGARSDEFSRADPSPPPPGESAGRSGPAQGKRDFVAESSKDNAAGRAIVIQRATELEDCVRVLESLGVPIQLVRGALPAADEVAGASVVVIAGTRLAEPGTPNLSLWPRTIAVVDTASKTMRAHLNRLGVALTVRRPIHPHTLRLLLLHEIYRGPERRRKKRIPIGHPIKVAAGLFTRRATLLELSSGGARVELPHTPKIGSRIKLYVGKDLTLGKPLKLQATVVRCIRPSGQNGRSEAEVGVALVDPKRDAKGIQAILDRFAKGPASWTGKIDAPSTTSPSKTAKPEASEVEAAATEAEASEVEAAAGSDAIERPAPRRATKLPPARPCDATPEPSSDATTAPDATSEGASAPEVTSPAKSAQAPGATAPAKSAQAEDPTPPVEDEAPEDAAEARRVFAMPPPDEDDADERRRDLRIPYEHRVVALGEEAARVVVGRDLSQGGMRIEASDAVDLGDTLRVALHCGTEMEPLVLLATADRDDGDEGMVLGFHDLGDGQRDHLEKIIASSSPIQTAIDEDDPNARTGSIVLGEMLETVKKGPSRPPEAIETEAQIDAHLDSIFDTD